jgi:steroid delta-isomerase-like uncharacterized protein
MKLFDGTRGTLTRTFLAWFLLSMSPLSQAAEPLRATDIAKQWYELFNSKDQSIIDRIVDHEWVDIPSPPGTPQGPEGLRLLFTELTTAFPDLQLTIEDVLQDGDKVVVRSTIGGTHRGALFGMPAKGRRLSIQAIDIHQIQNGKIVRTWHTEDWMTGLRQLGITGP